MKRVPTFLEVFDDMKKVIINAGIDPDPDIFKDAIELRLTDNNDNQAYVSISPYFLLDTSSDDYFVCARLPAKPNKVPYTDISKADLDEMAEHGNTLLLFVSGIESDEDLNEFSPLLLSGLNSKEFIKAVVDLVLPPKITTPELEAYMKLENRFEFIELFDSNHNSKGFILGRISSSSTAVNKLDGKTMDEINEQVRTNQITAIRPVNPDALIIVYNMMKSLIPTSLVETLESSDYEILNEITNVLNYLSNTVGTDTALFHGEIIDIKGDDE